MNQLKLLVLVAGAVGILYFVKSIKISVSGAQAVEQEASKSAPPPTQARDQVVKKNPRVKEKPSSEPVSEKTLDMVEHLANLIQRKKLCEFLHVVEDNEVGQKTQLQALGKSFGDEDLSELDVFVADISEYEDFRSPMARAYLLGKELGAFESLPHKPSQDFADGLKPADKDLLIKIAQLKSLDSGNLFYSLLSNNVYFRYKRLSEEKNQELYDGVMATSYFANPVFESMRKLYNRSKNNVAQFYLAQEIFARSLGVDKFFIQRTFWVIYAFEMRDHIAAILQKYLERNLDSAKSFGYEPGVYESYRAAVPYELYQQLPVPEGYEQTRVEPVYELKDLRPKLDQSCDQTAVDLLEIKLRAL